MATATSSQTSRARSGPLRSTFDAHGGAGRWASGWFMSFVAAWVHILVVNVAAATLGGFAWVVVYAAMPAATAFFVPESRSGLWRWLVLLILAGITSLDSRDRAESATSRPSAARRMGAGVGMRAGLPSTSPSAGL